MSIYKRLEIKSNIRDYPVLFTDNFIEGLKDHPDGKCFILIDKKVKKFYEKSLAPILKRFPHAAIQASEEHKTLEYINKIIRLLIDNNVKRGHTLVAIGGGILQDITGFISSVLYRGVEWDFYPTTLLAQSDSCIGSKTSINIGEYKNQVGNFYPPRKIFLNTGFLKTLSSNDIKSGLGEIIKVHLLDGEEGFRYITKRYDESLRNQPVMEDLIFRSLKIKKKVIEMDEFDQGYRNIMNYGHTFGHALESLTKYRLRHGQAVTVGMDISNYLSCKLGYIPERKYLQMRNILLKNWPVINLRSADLELFFKILGKDKKNTDRKIVAILTRGPGKMFKKAIALDNSVKNILRAYFQQILA